MEHEEIRRMIFRFAARLDDITPPKNQAETYEAAMLRADLDKLSSALEHEREP